MAARTPEHLAPKTLPNRKSPWTTVAEEQADRQEAAEAQLQVLRSLLPLILGRLARIPDPRRPRSVRHKLATLLAHGIMLFVYEYASRRQGNHELSRPEFLAVLRTVFPEWDTTPHTDTLERLLERIPAEDIEAALQAAVSKLLRNGKLRALMVEQGYVIAVDGSQKLVRSWPWAEEALRRKHGEATDYVAYVLQATLVGPQGVRIPLATEFCANEPQEQKADAATSAAAPPEGTEQQNPGGEPLAIDGCANEPREQNPVPTADAPPVGTEQRKQDCEIKAFKRLAPRLKAMFPRRRLLIVADGLYANGPVMAICRDYGWDFMLVLREGSLPSLSKEAEALHRLNPEDTCQRTWGDHAQTFWWVNGLCHEFGAGGRRHMNVHVVVCEEKWTTMDRDDTPCTHTARFAWVSAQPLTAKNVHARCNRAARHRWDIEEGFLAEKHHGYQFTHAFSYDWNAMRGWHYLMQIGELLNTLTCYSEDIWKWVCACGFRGTIAFLRESFTSPWLDHERLRALTARPPQLRLRF